MHKEIEIISQSQFIDNNYLVTTLIIRLFDETMNEAILSDPINDRLCYNTIDAYKKYIETVKKRRKDFENKIRKELNLQSYPSFTITQSLSEIFTVVAIRNYK